MTRLAWLPLLLMASCPALQQLTQPGGFRPAPPRIAIAEVTLVGYPTAEIIARGLCPRLAPGPICMILGRQPSLDQLRIVFGVQLDVDNPNTIPLPLVEALVAFTAFPGAQGSQNLGAVCVSMCEDPNNCPPRSDACTGGGPQIRTMNDFAGAAAGFLVAVAVGQDRFENLRIKTIAPNARMRVTVNLSLDPEQVLRLLATLASDAISQVKRGSVPRFIIPWSVEGSAWVTVQGLGKLAAGFGPLQGSWELK